MTLAGALWLASAAPPPSLAVDPGAPDWLVGLAIIVGTFILEDPTTIATGLLIRQGDITPALGLGSLAIGIYAGDLGLYLLGVVAGRRILSWGPVRARLPAERLDGLGRWIDERGFWPVVASRFVPGSRFPLYIAAGALGRRPGRFALWTLLAVGVWAPAMLGAVVLLDGVTAPSRASLGGGWLALVVTVVAFLVILRTVPLLFTEIGRARLRARIARLWRWEFWPAWIFYLPVLPWIVWLSIRHRGFNTITAANPAIPHGGFVGESKLDILERLPRDVVVPSAAVPPGPVEERVGAVERAMAEGGWSYPVVLKPDAGERGASVRRAADVDDVARYLERVADPVLVQPMDPGPLEAGILYVRDPRTLEGAIFSITDKRFPSIEGDGRATLRRLIWRHPRYRMQARTFLRRHEGELDSIPEAGERVRLAMAGNHCQGTMFVDGHHLVTAALTAAIDRIATGFGGLDFGRFDVRYASTDALRAGHGFRIVELNGATSESTNIYDASRGLLAAYRTLYRQWAILFRIGAANRSRGVVPTSHRQMFYLLRRHYLSRSVDPLSS